MKHVSARSSSGAIAPGARVRVRVRVRVRPHRVPLRLGRGTPSAHATVQHAAGQVDLLAQHVEVKFDTVVIAHSRVRGCHMITA